MEKFRVVYNYLSSFNLAYILVLGLLGKALISDVSYPTFLITVPILCFEGYKLYIKSKEPVAYIHDKAIMDELDKLKAKLNAQSLDKNINSVPKRYF